MKNLKIKFYKVVIVIAFAIPLILIAAGCGNYQPAKANNAADNTETMVAIGIDLSKSVNGFRKIDTGFIARICRAIAKTGGFIAVYGIGEPNDKSGLRCQLKHLPVLDATLPISKQAEQKLAIDELKAYNDRQINEFLKTVEEQVLGPPGKASAVMHTDINGFFAKINVLLGEPDNQLKDKYVFVYSDGIESVDGPDKPASYEFTSKNNFTLCLAGWKTAMPTKGIEIKQFESTQGFAQYMESVTSLKN